MHLLNCTIVALGGAAVPKTYMFVDGAYLDGCVSDFCKRWFGGQQYELDYRTLSGSCEKVFCYDAMPLQRKEEPDDKFKLREVVKLTFFDRLRALRGWHVHLGISKRHKGGVAQQKEVDVLLAVDMLTHTHRKNMDSVIFVAGDQDFRPLLDAVVRDGMYVTLYYDKSSTSADLINMADARQEFDYFTMMQMFPAHVRTAHPVPDRSTHHGIYLGVGTLLEEGFRDGQDQAQLWLTLGGDSATHQVAMYDKAAHNTHVYNLKGNPELLKQAFMEYFGDFEWKPLKKTA